MQVIPNPQWRADDLREVAKWQKYICWAILAQIAAILLMVFAAVAANNQQNTTAAAAADTTGLITLIVRIVAVGFSIVCVYNLAKALRISGAILYAVAMFLPLIGLLAIISLSDKATKLLKEHGIKVGVMGADMSDIDRIKAQENNTPSYPGL